MMTLVMYHPLQDLLRTWFPDQDRYLESQDVPWIKLEYCISAGWIVIGEL